MVTVQGTGSVVQDASGNNALATLTFVGSGAVLALLSDVSLTVNQGLTSQGVIGASGSLTVSGTYTQETGATTNVSGVLSRAGISVEVEEPAME